MIGTSIRSVRHLFRVSDASLKTVLVKFKENAWDICKVVKFPQGSSFGETMFIFNNYFRQSHWGYDSVIVSNDFRKLFKAEDVTSHACRVISVNSSEFPSFSGMFQEITLLPDSFDSDYEKFLKDNNKMVTNLCSKYGIATRDTKMKRLYIYSDGSKNFFQWAVNSYYQNGTSMSVIKSILLWNESYKQLAKNLSKGTITAYTSRDSIVKLLKELGDLRKDKRINDSINSFNTTQKKLFKNNKLTDDDKQALWRLSRLSETKRLNFIKKVSSITDFNELVRQLRFATSVHFSWSKESFMDFLENVEGIKYEKVYDNENVVLVKVIDYETIKQLGKTTNWCISKNKTYWNNYIENYHGVTTQYMIFDFSKLEDDKLSIVGFTTTRNKGITSAHNFVNENLMGGEEGEQVFLNSFISRFKESKNIYSVLADDGIDITLVVQYDMPPYKWDEHSLMDYLYECVNPENVDIIKKSEGKIVLSIMDENIRYFLGDAYHDNISSDYWSYQHILFIDLNKSVYDINKLQFAIIEEGGGDEDYCMGLYNERALGANQNFDTKLIEFGLPYNTIRRTNDPYVRLRNGLFSYNTPMIKACVAECGKDVIKKMITKDVGTDTFYDMILRTVRSHMSFDYLDLIYDNGLKLTDIFSASCVGDILKQFVHDMRNLSRATTMFKNIEAVSEENIKNFYDGNYGRDDTKYIGFFVAIKMIIDKEKGISSRDYNSMFKRTLNFIANDGKNSQLYDELFNMFKDKMDYSLADDATYCIIKYAIYCGGEEAKKFIENKAKESSNVKKYYEAIYRDYERTLSFAKKSNNSGVYTVRIDNNPIDHLEFEYAIAPNGDAF